ncbi:hypothetical protein BDD12DRAFT_887013 [Trichophaea hybrida]|nr:hypothetical protein BDD12DRAFT_887013 [Trichophaea hybrida]
MIQLLSDHGADIEAEDDSRRRPLHIAVENSQEATVFPTGESGQASPCTWPDCNFLCISRAELVQGRFLRESLLVLQFLI